MVDVDLCDTSCEMMGQKTSLPIFISPAGMAGLAHPQAERLLAGSAGECGIIQMVSIPSNPRSFCLLPCPARATYTLRYVDTGLYRA